MLQQRTPNHSLRDPGPQPLDLGTSLEHQARRFAAMLHVSDRVLAGISHVSGQRYLDQTMQDGGQ